MLDEEGQNSMFLFAEIFQRHMAAIGVITVRWSSIDKDMYEILRDRLNSSVEAEAFRRLGSGKARLRHFRSNVDCSSLAVEKKSVLLSDVDRLIELYEDRNSIVHGQYGMFFDEDGEMSVYWEDIRVQGAGFESGSESNPARVTVEHLMGHANEVHEASKQIRSFLHGKSLSDAGRK